MSECVRYPDQPITHVKLECTEVRHRNKHSVDSQGSYLPKSAYEHCWPVGKGILLTIITIIITITIYILYNYYYYYYSL